MEQLLPLVNIADYKCIHTCNHTQKGFSGKQVCFCDNCTWSTRKKEKCQSCLFAQKIYALIQIPASETS